MLQPAQLSAAQCTQCSLAASSDSRVYSQVRKSASPCPAPAPGPSCLVGAKLAAQLGRAQIRGNVHIIVAFYYSMPRVMCNIDIMDRDSERQCLPVVPPQPGHTRRHISQGACGWGGRACCAIDG